MKIVMRAVILTGLFISVAVNAAPGGYGGGRMSSSSLANTYEGMAVDAYNSGLKQRDKAKKFEEKAQGLEPGNKKDKLLAKSRKAYSKAIWEFKEATEYDPANYRAFSSMGFALRKVGEFQESLKAYNEALAINPNYYEAIEYRAEAYLQLQRFSLVVDAYKKLSAEEPKYADMLWVAIGDWLSYKNTDAHSEMKKFANWYAQEKESRAKRTFAAE